MNYLIQTHGLTKKYRSKIAVDHIDLNIKEGEIYGLIGKNGAGKTTVMRMLSGLSNPTEGSYSLFGKEGHELHSEMRNVGVLIEAPGIFPKLSAYDNLKMKCLAMGCDSKAYIEGLLELVGLADTGKKRVGAFSLGMRQRLGIALALAGDPALIILDEPINGLDPQGIADIRNTLSVLRSEKHITIMISSHILEELEKLADTYGIINEGKLIDEFTTEDLHNKSGNYTMIATDDNEKAAGLISEMGIEGITQNGRYLRLPQKLDKDINVVKYLVQKDIFVREVREEFFSLEDYYLSVTKEGGNNNG